MNRNAFQTLIASLSIAAILGAGATSVTAQIAVFDPSNYSQNILQAARALQQVNNQIQSLQHEAQMLQNMATNLKTLNVSSLVKINSDLAAINELMTQAKGIAFTLSQTQSALKSNFPSTYSATVSSSTLATDAQTRWDMTMQAYQQTLLVQSKIDESLQSDASTLSDLLSASDAAQGGLQAQQATNQLTALSTKQQMQIATLMAAQYRAEAIDAARKAQAEAAAKVMTAKFLGTGTAYTPQ